jgi:septal ring factor EnvC (AmiA/AmiB activator)
MADRNSFFDEILVFIKEDIGRIKSDIENIKSQRRECYTSRALQKEEIKNTIEKIKRKADKNKEDLSAKITDTENSILILVKTNNKHIYII